MVHIGKEAVYREVHMFVDWLWDVVPIYGAHILRSNVVECLRGRASMWSSTESRQLVNLVDQC